MLNPTVHFDRSTHWVSAEFELASQPSMRNDSIGICEYKPLRANTLMLQTVMWSFDNLIFHLH